MKFHLQMGDGDHIIRGYGPGQITVDRDIYRASIVVLPQRIIEDCLPRQFHELAATHFETLAGLEPELVILGTGRHLHFPPPQITTCLMDASIGLEVMDTAAACRTYNILMGEGRRVVAALLMIEDRGRTVRVQNSESIE